jgi:hypothetical protein
MYNNCKNKIILFEIKIIYYILFFVVAIMINDIMKTPQENLTKMTLIFSLSLIFIAIFNYLIEYYYNYNNSYKFYVKLLVSITVSIGVFIAAALFYYFTVKKNDDLFESFIDAYDKNISFLIFITILFYIIYLIFKRFYADTAFSDIVTPSILAIFLMLYIFGFIIFVCNKIGLINDQQYLTTFIVLGSIVVVLIIFYLYFVMSSLQDLCSKNNNNQEVSKDSSNERVILVALATIVGILWLDDERNWHQIGYLFFILLSIYAAYFVFYYSALHPSLSLLSLWLLVEWLILFFYRNTDSKNSVQFVFMKT